MKNIHVVELNLSHVMKTSLIITVVTFLLCTFLFIILTPTAIHLSGLTILLSLLLITLLYFIFIVIHEACHLIGFIVFGRAPLSSLKWGIDFKKGIAYATTSHTLTNRAMKRALLLPFWLTGVLPCFIGFYMDSYILIVVGVLLIGGAAGDFAMYQALRKFPPHVIVKDDPQAPKLYIELDATTFSTK